MYIESPSSIKVSLQDFAKFTHGEATMDLIDVTYVDSHSPGSTMTSEVSAPYDSKVTGESTPGDFVYRLDLTLDNEKLEGSDVVGMTVEISPKKFDFFINDNYENIQNLTNKSQIIANKLLSQDNVETLDVTIDYRSDLASAQNKALTQNANSEIEYQAFYESSEKNDQLNKIPVFSSNANMPKVDIKNLTLETGVKNALSAGIDPFDNILSIDAHKSLESQFSLSNNDIFVYEEDAVRVKNRNLPGLVSLSAERARHKSEVLESKGYSEASKEALKLSALLSGQDDPVGKVQLGFVGSVKTKQFRVIRDIEVPKRILGSSPEFFVRVRPIVKGFGASTSLVEAKSFVFTVQHMAQVDAISDPVVSCSLSVADQKNGNITLDIEPRDPMTQGVVITRRIYNPSKGRFEQPYTIRTDGSFSSRVVDDRVDNVLPNKVYYTAATVDKKGSLGPTSSLVVDGVAAPNAPAKEEDQNAKIYVHNTERGVAINVENIPTDVKMIRIMRENMSVPGDLKQRTTSIFSDNLDSSNLETERIKTIQITDTNVNDNQSYRYFLVIKNGRGLGYTSEDDDIITRRYPRKPLPYDVYCGDAKVISVNPKMQVGIELSVAHKQENYEFFLRLLKNSGADKNFLDEIKKNRKFLSDVIAFNIDRIDAQTGKKVNLGLYGPGVFLDGAGGGSISKLGGLKSGKKYVYLIKVCVRPIQSFFTSLFSSIISPKQTSGTKNTTFMSKKFTETANRFLGALPSDEDLREGGSPSKDLTASETGLTFTKVFKTAKMRAKVTEFKQSMLPFASDKLARFSFKVGGGPRGEVLYALIMCKKLGSPSTGDKIIDKVAISPEQEIYYFDDSVRPTQVGGKSYTVKLVYSDLKVSGPSKPIILKKSRSLPSSFTGVLAGRLEY